MSEKTEGPPSVLFTLRFWYEPLGEDRGEWRGEVKNLGSGETRYFRQWDEIADLLSEMLVGSVDGEGEVNRTKE